MNKKVTGNLCTRNFLWLLGVLSILLQSSISNASEALFRKKIEGSGVQKIIDSGVLRLAVIDLESPPFYYTDPDGYEGVGGLSVELGKKIAKELGVKLKIIRKTSVFNELVQSVARGEADIAMSKLSIALPRAAYAEHTQPYIDFRKAILVSRLKFAELKKKPDESIYEFFNRGDVSIGVIGNSSYETFARELFPKGKIVGYPSWKAVEKALEDGEVAGIFRDEFEIARTLRSIPEGSINFMSVVLKGQNDPIAMIVPWDRQHLVNWLNHFMNSKNISYSNKDILEMLEVYNQKNKK